MIALALGNIIRLRWTLSLNKPLVSKVVIASLVNPLKRLSRLMLYSMSLSIAAPPYKRFAILEAALLFDVVELHDRHLLVQIANIDRRGKTQSGKAVRTIPAIRMLLMMAHIENYVKPAMCVFIPQLTVNAALAVHWSVMIAICQFHHW